MSFHSQLSAGKLGEGIIGQWFQARGYNVLPVYEKELSEGKGPVLFSASNMQLIAPDMLVFNNDKTFWIEAKTKSHFSWHRISRQWVTGIDVHHYENYINVQKLVSWPVWLLFLHLDQTGAKDTPNDLTGSSPVGLFGNNLKKLIQCENHRHSAWGKKGMVYWSSDNLILLDTINNITKE